MALEDLGKEVVKELDLVKTWFSPGSAKHLKVAQLADKVAEATGGREEASVGDPEQTPTPGPGVRGAHVVDAVGDIDDADVDPPETTYS